MAKLKFYAGTMRNGKSGLALQLNYNFKIANKRGVMFTMNDRGGVGKITSRLGIDGDAISITEFTNIFDLFLDLRLENVDYLIFDEVQFYTPKQIDDIASLVDNYNINIYCFGLKTDFRGYLFDGSKRLIELADEVKELEVKALCWCGRKALFNARVKGGVLVLDGEQIDVGDGQYEVLCREHFNTRITKKVAIERGLLDWIG